MRPRNLDRTFLSEIVCEILAAQSVARLMHRRELAQAGEIWLGREEKFARDDALLEILIQFEG